MTVTTRFITSVDDLGRLWHQLWPMIQAFEAFHADMTGKTLREGREAYNRAHLEKKLDPERYWLQIAEEEGRVVGMASLQILEKGTVLPEPIGYAGLLYILPEYRGSGLNQRMHDERNALLRSKGISFRESSHIRGNSGFTKRWNGEDWGASMSRPIRSSLVQGDAGARRVKDLDADWPALWLLLAPASSSDEATARAELAEALERRSAAFIAADGSGVVVGRINVNPWMFEERVGHVRSFAVRDGAPAGTHDALLDAVEAWMLKKHASAIHTRAMPQAETAAWLERGFEPYIVYRKYKLGD